VRQFFLSADGGSVSRRNVLNELGGTGNVNLVTRRQWAVAWNLLSRAGFICPEPGNPGDGDWWFLAPAGRSAATADFEGALQLALGQR
jgi:hypothetical protein